MNKKTFGIALALLVLLAVGVVFAAERVSLDWSGSTVIAKNPNKKTDLNEIQVCVVYRDGEGKKKDFTSEKFNLGPQKTKSIYAPGTVISASAVTCSVLFDRE